MATIAITVLSVIVLAALVRGVIAFLWSRSDEGQVQARGHDLGWW